ncbi:MAG: T9SS type A sorting domain-containing protein [Bacteroidales bacterium]|nr:T9SS type A sorting domain-containing protein [Bacteroidales bacterium]
MWFPDADEKDSTRLQITIRNFILAHNTLYGLNWTDAGAGANGYAEVRAHIHNNFIYNNSYEVYNWGDSWGYNVTDDNTTDTVGLWDHRYYNNVSYVNPESRDELNGLLAEDRTASYNRFNVIGTPVTNLYFLSLDTTGMLGGGTRKADGSLPDTYFGKPASGSPLIDAGIDVFGIGYNGEAPDIGWYESSSGSVTPATLVYVSSSIQNATPSRLEMTYNLTLANIVPAPSSFTVMVNSSARSITSVAISGNKVLLTLSSPVVYGDVVTVAYTKPATNPLQTASGGQAASISAQTVTNRVSPPLPVYLGSEVENATPARLEMTYSLTLANIIPAASAFTVRINSTTRSVNSVTISGTNVILTLASPVVYGDVVTVAYTKPATNPLQTTFGGQAATITTQTVKNNCLNQTAPTNQPPIISISSPTKNSSFISPATIEIEAVASDPDGTIGKVELYNGNIKLFELTTTPYSYTWKDVGPGTYSLTAVATDNLNATSTSSAVEMVVVLVAPVNDPNSGILNLYPNPNDGHFTIELLTSLQNEMNIVTVINLTGESVYKGTLLKEEDTRQFDLLNLKSGIYILRIISDEIIVTKKFIKR